MTPDTLPTGAIGTINDVKNSDGSIAYENLIGKVVDGPTGFVFDSMEAWEAHVSPVSGTTPTDPKYLIDTTTPDYERIAEAAILRGKGEVPPDVIQ